MYCKHCGKEIDDESKFCNYCGKELSLSKKKKKSKIKYITILTLITILAIALTIGVIILLWYEFHDFEWKDGFLGAIFSIFIAALWFFNPVNCLAYGLCLGAWGIIYTLREQFFGDSSSIEDYSYTGIDDCYSSSDRDDINDAIRASYDKDYYYDDIDNNDDKYSDPEY